MYSMYYTVLRTRSRYVDFIQTLVTMYPCTLYHTRNGMDTARHSKVSLDRQPKLMRGFNSVCISVNEVIAISFPGDSPKKKSGHKLEIRKGTFGGCTCVGK